MALSKDPIVIFAAADVPAGGTKLAPATGGTGNAIALTNAGSGSTVGMRIRNTSGAPAAPGVMTLQQSPDGGVSWYDVHSIWGGTAANDDVSVTITIARGIKLARVLCYGNTVVPVRFDATAGVVTD